VDTIILPLIILSEKGIYVFILLQIFTEIFGLHPVDFRVYYFYRIKERTENCGEKNIAEMILLEISR